jgi:multimeric flavodoxin WrbA
MTTQRVAALKALALVCSLKPSPAPSSSQLLADQASSELHGAGVSGELVRCVDFDIKPDAEADIGDGDQWPEIREKVHAADILVFATPTPMGHLSSVAQRVLERLDAELPVADDAARPVPAGKIAIVPAVGNEDGAHTIIADLFQSLNDVGYTIPAQGCTYRNGAAMKKTDDNDLNEAPKSVRSATAAAAHLAAKLEKRRLSRLRKLMESGCLR